MDYEDNRLVTGAVSFEDTEEISLRPKKFDEYIGQEKVRSNLSVFIEAAKGTCINVGAQNIHWAESGAYTGEISGDMTQEMVMSAIAGGEGK